MLRFLALGSLLWAFENFLIGATTACVMSLLSAARNATCSVLDERLSRYRLPACLTFCGSILTAAALTWGGTVSLLPMCGALISTTSTFYLSGVTLRVALACSNVLWLCSAIHFRAWDQVFSLSTALLASSYGIWQAHQAAASRSRELQMLSPQL
jgi:hypothetical protein